MKSLNQYIIEFVNINNIKKDNGKLTVGKILSNYMKQMLPAGWLNYNDVKEHEECLLNVKRPLLKRLLDYTPLRFIYTTQSRYSKPECTWIDCYKILQREKYNEPITFNQDYNSGAGNWKITLTIKGINKTINLITKEKIE